MKPLCTGWGSRPTWHGFHIHSKHIHDDWQPSYAMDGDRDPSSSHYHIMIWGVRWNPGSLLQGTKWSPFALVEAPTHMTWFSHLHVHLHLSLKLIPAALHSTMSLVWSLRKEGGWRQFCFHSILSSSLGAKVTLILKKTANKTYINPSSTLFFCLNLSKHTRVFLMEAGGRTWRKIPRLMCRISGSCNGCSLGQSCRCHLSCASIGNWLYLMQLSSNLPKDIGGLFL